MPRRSSLALAGAATGLALLFITWFAAFHIHFFERVDQSIFRGFADIHHRARLTHEHINVLARLIAGLCNLNEYVFLIVVPIVIALARRRYAVAIAIGGILLGANLTTEVLKPLLAQPRPTWYLGDVEGILPASWPSGHATAAMSLALCMVLAVPARLRPAVAAAGALFAVAVSYSFLLLGWHYPSDVIGGFLVASIWTLLAVAALYALRARRGQLAPSEPAVARSARKTLGPPAVLVLVAAALALVVALARPHQVASYARNHEAFMFGVIGIGALALALATGVMLAVRR